MRQIIKVVLTIVILFAVFFAKAQTTDSVRIAINDTLTQQNKTIIPTGILAENGIYINHSPPLHYFFK